LALNVELPQNGHRVHRSTAVALSQCLFRFHRFPLLFPKSKFFALSITDRWHFRDISRPGKTQSPTLVRLLRDGAQMAASSERSVLTLAPAPALTFPALHEQLTN
jgi:hypothetical protein